ncbi:hypothetical protein [Natrialba magadii]|nr:hypothetical protein [Natrialba magadii]
MAVLEYRLDNVDRAVDAAGAITETDDSADGITARSRNRSRQ